MRQVLIIGGLLCLQSAIAPLVSADMPEPPGLGDPGPLVSLSLESNPSREIALAGRDARAQLIVTGTYETGQQRDLTRHVTYSTSNSKTVSVDSSGYLQPLAEGQVTVRAAAAGGESLEMQIHVTHLENDLPVNFPNEVVPVFTKYGCNGGGCHGKSGGQNGFRLSLLGFVPDDDYRYLVKEGRSRRLFPAAPDRSLLLLKAIGETPHGGGARMEKGSLPYQIIRRWIEQGMPYGQTDDPSLVRIEVTPRERVMPRDGSQQLSVTAHYSDGSRRDVTRMTHFESNDPDLAEVTEQGLVTTQTSTGSVAIMTRFQSHVDVYRATVPLGLEVKQLPPAKNLVDELVFKNLRKLGLPPSPLAEDATFLRRVTIDIAGRLPTREETTRYLTNDSPSKRDELVARLVNSGDYADYFANKWSSILRNRRSDKNVKIASYNFHDWIRDSLDQDKPYDQFVSQILSASGPVRRNPPVAWFHEVSDASSQVEDTAQLFLGMRIQCAKCHHHPFEKWSQDDYYGMAAFFSRVGRKNSDLRGKQDIFHRPGKATAQNPNSERRLPPTPLDSQPVALSDDDDPRLALTAWMSSPENPFFAKALVNRYWKHFFGRGLVDPEDDMRVTNPACNPELLEALAADFVDRGFSLKHLVNQICTSQTYALSAIPNAYNQQDKQNFSRFYPRRLNAEVLLDAIDRLTDSPTTFGGVAKGTRAVQLPDNDFDSYFLTVFGRPAAASACECERSSDVNLAQCLHLLNSKEVQSKLGGPRTQRLVEATASQHADLDAALDQVYLVAFSRLPTADERKIAAQYIRERDDAPQQAFEDILWAVINTKEFVFNH